MRIKFCWVTLNIPPMFGCCDADEATAYTLVVEVVEDIGYQAIQAPYDAGGLKILRSDRQIDLLVQTCTSWAE